MLKRRMKNDAIHFYFNRPDRLISSGRITQIKQNKYGASVQEAKAEELEAFLQNWQQQQSGRNTLIDPTDPSTLQSQFRQAAGKWTLVNGETDRAECKKSFKLSPEVRFADVIKSIAGLANNNGGYIFFGVANAGCTAEGLSDDLFGKTDPAEINRCLASALDPVPRISKHQIQIGEKSIGVLHVEKNDHGPVIALKNVGNDLKEGAIYFRYVGETRAIKPGELRKIISQREQRAVSEFAQRMARVASGTDATINLDNGEVSGTSGNFIIDQKLLPSIQFIREGDFSQTMGAPTLKLIGTVKPAEIAGGFSTRIVRDNVTPDALIRNFLVGEQVADPTQYLHAHAHVQRRWLPVWYYLGLKGISASTAIDDLRQQIASYPSIRDAVIQRLLMKTSAIHKHAGKPAKVLAAILSGNFSPPETAEADMIFAAAIQGLPDAHAHASKLKPILLTSLDRAQGADSKSGNRRSSIYRAACRLDEILHRQK